MFKIFGKKRFESITLYLQKLHFLPIRYRTKFKINVITYKCINYKNPKYLYNLLIIHSDNVYKKTRKAEDKTWLRKHPIQKLVYKEKGYRYSAPIAWNGLDLGLRKSETAEIFKRNLKTFYF